MTPLIFKIEAFQELPFLPKSQLIFHQSQRGTMIVPTHMIDIVDLIYGVPIPLSTDLRWILQQMISHEINVSIYRL